MTLLFALACAHVATPPAAPPPVPSEPVPPELPAPEPTMSHPGTITFVDHAKGTTQVRPVADVPAALAWYEGVDGRVPVVRIEASDRGGALEIKRYGPDGAFLDVTVAR